MPVLNNPLGSVAALGTARGAAKVLGDWTRTGQTCTVPGASLGKLVDQRRCAEHPTSPFVCVQKSSECSLKCSDDGEVLKNCTTTSSKQVDCCETRGCPCVDQGLGVP